MLLQDLNQTWIKTRPVQDFCTHWFRTRAMVILVNTVIIIIIVFIVIMVGKCCFGSYGYHLK